MAAWAVTPVGDWDASAYRLNTKNGCRQVLMVGTPHGTRVEIYESPAGKSVRVFVDGTECKPVTK